jgi:hypothetical protein
MVAMCDGAVIFFCFAGDDRAWADEAHFALQDINDLRQFVYTRAASDRVESPGR